MVDVRRDQQEAQNQPHIEEDEITEENVFDRYDEPQGFFPGQVIADLTVSAVLLVIVIVLAYWVPAPLTEPAEISTTVYVPRPEWFFFFLDQWLIFFPGAVLIAIADVIVPALFVIWLLAIPWLDKEPSHSMGRRPYIVVIGFLVINVIVFKMILAMGMITKQRRYDRFARNAAKTTLLLFAVGSSLAFTFILALITLYPVLFSHLQNIFFWVFLAETFMFVGKVITVYAWYIAWDKMAYRKNLHVTMGFVAGLFGLTQMIFINVVAAYMLTPSNAPATEVG